MSGTGPGPYAALYYNIAIIVIQINVQTKGEEIYLHINVNVLACITQQ